MNYLYYGDNLEILRKHLADESVDLVYIDPPFNSKRDYNVIYDGATAQTKAFGDTWSVVGVEELEHLIYQEEAQRYHTLHRALDGLKQILYYSPTAQDKSMYAYLINMGVRLVEMRRALKETGSFYLHCDPTAGHYLKILLDAVFGRENFLNEVVWCYRRYTAASNRFQRLHDTVFFYGKGRNTFFNDIRIPYTEKSGAKDSHYKQDEDGKWYRWQKRSGQEPYKIYLSDGVRLGDWWDIPIINASAKERLGYPTQKPEALLERILQASCPKGGVVLDAYCGCGTTIAVAQRLGMHWIGIDITYLAVDLIQQRLIDQFYLEGAAHPTKAQQEKARVKFLRDTEVFGIPKDLESARKLARETKGDYVRKEFEKWAVFSVGGVYSEKKGSDGGVDGYFYIYDVDAKGKAAKKHCYIQVKSGKIGVKELREFDSTLNSLQSPIGIFVTLEEPTKPMVEYAASLPKYRSAMGRNYDKISIVTIEQIMAEDVPDFAVRATKRAVANHDEATVGDLFLDSE
jgi:site-specific DNA-methyltransferase (adenine-specific)